MRWRGGPAQRDVDAFVGDIDQAVGQLQVHLNGRVQAQERITAGDQEAAGVISFVPELRPLVAAGLVEGIVNFRGKTVLSPARRGDGFEQEIKSWARQ